MTIETTRKGAAASDRNEVDFDAIADLQAASPVVRDSPRRNKRPRAAPKSGAASKRAARSPRKVAKDIAYPSDAASAMDMRVPSDRNEFDGVLAVVQQAVKLEIRALASQLGKEHPEETQALLDILSDFEENATRSLSSLAKEQASVFEQLDRLGPQEQGLAEQLEALKEELQQWERLKNGIDIAQAADEDDGAAPPEPSKPRSLAEAERAAKAAARRLDEAAKAVRRMTTHMNRLETDGMREAGDLQRKLYELYTKLTGEDEATDARKNIRGLVN